MPIIARYGRRVRSHLVRLTLLSQLVFFGGILVCILLQPHYLFSANMGGISNYGVHRLTAVPYSVAVGGAALVLALAARATPRPTVTSRHAAAGLWSFSAVLAGVLATTYPYQHGPALKDLHVAVGAVAVGFELIAASWAVATILGDTGDRVVLAIELAGGVLAGCTLAGVVHLLFVSQLVTSGAFGILLVRVATRLAQDDGVAPQRPRRPR